MDFQLLAAADAETQEIPERAEQAELYLLRAKLLLGACAHKQFQNKRLLEQATEALLKSLSRQRCWAEPHIWLAFVLHLVGDFKRAQKYLKRAEQLQPENPQIAAMWALFQAPAFQILEI